MSITLLNMDCMEYMRSVPDKHFDLAIFVGTELDADYFQAAKARFDRETAQIQFDFCGNGE